MKPTLLILAAGIGSRYGGLKQVDGMGPGGEAIIEYSIYDAIRAGFGKVVFVIRKDIEAEFKATVGKKIEKHIPVEYAFQEINTGLEWMPTPPKREKPWGTAHAILAAKAFLTEPFAAINADDYYGATAYQTLYDFLTKKCSPTNYAMVGYQLAKTLSENGSVSRGVCSVNDQGMLTEVVERTKIQRIGAGIYFVDDQGKKHRLRKDTPVSMNYWGFHPNILGIIETSFKTFVAENADKPKAEFFIPLIVNNLIQADKIKLSVLKDKSQWFGVTYPEDKPTVQNALKQFVQGGVYQNPLWKK